VLFDHSPFYGGSLLRRVAGSAKTAMLNRFVSTPFYYFDAIQPMFRFTIRDVLWLTVVVGLAVTLWQEHRRFRVVNAALQEQQAIRRVAELRAKELRGQVIIDPSPQ